MASQYDIIKHETIANCTSATALTVPAGITARTAWVQALGQNVRYKMDGNDPATDAGQRLTAGDPPLVLNSPKQINSFKAIDENGSGASLEIIYFGNNIS